ncbi:hypothetical protein SESBI_18167 [Sesbania bispinosa]|nr:hypothetical protein SESBI_18167 [Sesbania bispinosa]
MPETHNEEQEIQETELSNTQDTGGVQSTIVVSGTPDSTSHVVEGGVYGPWMLVKKLPRKKPQGKNQVAAIQQKTSQTHTPDSGTRYAILNNADNHDTATTQNVADLKETEQLPDPKITTPHLPLTRVRNPKAGKNPQTVPDKRKLQAKPLLAKGADTLRKDGPPKHAQLSSPSTSNSVLTNTIVDHSALEHKRK